MCESFWNMMNKIIVCGYIIISVFLLWNSLIYEIIYWSKCPAGDAFFPLLFQSEICWVLCLSDLYSTTHVPPYHLPGLWPRIILSSPQPGTYSLPFTLVLNSLYHQWTPFLKTIRWSWYSNRFRFGQFSLLMQNTENVDIGDESNVPRSVDSKDVTSAGQTDIIDNIKRLK